MPTTAQQHRVSIGCFVPTLISLLTKKAQSSARVRSYRGLKVGRRNMTQAIAAFFFALLVVHGVERNPGPGDKIAEGGKTGTTPNSRPATRQATLTSSGHTKGTPPAAPATPTLSDIMEKLIAMESMQTKVDSINTNVSDIKQDLADIKESINFLSGEIDDLKGKVANLEAENNTLKKSCVGLTEKVNALERTVDECDGRWRKNNLLVFGMKKDERDSRGWRERICLLLREKLGIWDVELEDVYPLGHNADSPVLMRCKKQEDKARILKAKLGLKGTGIYINEDLTEKGRERRKVLDTRMKELKAQGKKVKMRNDGLLVNEERLFLSSDGVNLTNKKDKKE